jgi:hypothetical protein
MQDADCSCKLDLQQVKLTDRVTGRASMEYSMRHKVKEKGKFFMQGSEMDFEKV